MQHKNSTRDRNREIYRRAGREARRAGRPISDCPQLHLISKGSVATWLQQQWREGWLQEDHRLRQLPLKINE